MRRLIKICGAFFVSAVMIATISERYLDYQWGRADFHWIHGWRTSRNIDRNFDFLLGLNENLGEHQCGLGSVLNCIIKTVPIGRLKHQVSEEFFGGHLLYLLPRKSAGNWYGGAGADKLRTVFRRLPLIENAPRLLQIFGGRSTFIEKRQLICRRISAIADGSGEIYSSRVGRISADPWLRTRREINESPFTDDIVFPYHLIVLSNQRSLPPRETSRGAGYQESQNRDWSSEAIIAAAVFIVCCGAWWGERGHWYLGITLVIVGGMLFTFGVYSICLNFTAKSAAPGIDCLSNVLSARCNRMRLLPPAPAKQT